MDPIIRRLLDARVRAGRSQRDVAAAAGTTAATLCEAETGKLVPRLETVRRWAAVLGLKLTLVAVPGSGGEAARVAPPNSLDHLVAEPGPVPKDSTDG